MKDSAASLYKSAKFSDTTVQVRKLQQLDEEIECASSPAVKRVCMHPPGPATTGVSAPTGATPEPQQAQYVLVEEFPAHKLRLHDACQYFQAMSNWEELSVVRFDVEDQQVVAAQALVYFMYHHALLPDMHVGDVAQLLILADKYQFEKCTQASVRHLQSLLNEGTDCEAAVEVIALVWQMGGACPALNNLQCYLYAQRHTLRQGFSSLVTVPYSDSPGQARPQRQPFDRAVTRLKSMFQHLDWAMSQPDFPRILGLFPLEVVLAVLSWDGLCCTSENAVAAAVGEWLNAQRADRGRQHSEPHDRALCEKALLQVVRTPYLTSSYSTHALPAKSWMQHHAHLAGLLRSLAAWHQQQLGQQHTASEPRPAPAVSAEHADLVRYALRPRQYRTSLPQIPIHLDLHWKDVQHMKVLLERGDEDGSCLLDSATAWVNGFSISLCACVSKAEGPAASSPASLKAFFRWRDPDLGLDLSRDGTGDAHLIATYRLEASSSKDTPSALLCPPLSQERCFVHRGESACHVLLPVLPANLAQLAEDGQRGCVTLTFTELQ